MGEFVGERHVCMCHNVLRMLYCVAVSEISQFVGEKKAMLYVSQCVEFVVLCCCVSKNR